MSEFFLKIVNMSIAAGWIMLVVLLLRLLLKKAPKWMRMILWGIVAIRLIFPFSIESVLSLIPSAETISPEIMLDRTPEIHSGISSFNHVINPIIGEAFAPNPMDSANPLQIWIPILANIWLLGMIGMVLYSIFSYHRVKRKVRTAVLLHDNIFQSENVFSPFVLGMIKPKIYLPFHINEHDLEYVIAHENAHIRRKDHWWKPFGFLILTLHWFNPLMWFGYVLFCRDIELACDEKVVQKLNHEQKANYSQALLNCSVNRHVIAACPLAFGEVGVKDRVKMVLCYKKPAFWLVLIAIIASAIVAVCFLTDPKREIESNGIEIHMDITFDAVELVYDDGMYSFVQTIDKTPEYMLVNDMQLLEKTGESVSEPLGKFREITLNKNNFDSRFRSKSKECWPEKDTFRSIKRNNVRAWQLYANSSSNIPYLYILLEQKDGTFYLGHGYYDFKSNVSNNPDSSHIRWLYKLKKVDSDVEGNMSEELPDSNAEAMKQPPTMVVVSNEQSIEALQGTASWTSQNADGTSRSTEYDSSHPLLLKQSMPYIDILPPYAVFEDTLDAILSFNVKDVYPIAQIKPDKLSIRCWSEKDWENAKAKGESIDYNIVNGNIFIELKDGNYIYEVSATWSSHKKFKGTVRYSFYTVKFNPNNDLYPKIGKNSKIEKTFHETEADMMDKAYENEEFIITKTHHQMDDGLWVSRGYGYMYRLEITGRMHNAAKNTTYIVLSNSKDITFDQTWKASGFSSNMDDYFHPEDAVIVGHRLFE